MSDYHGLSTVGDLERENKKLQADLDSVTKLFKETRKNLQALIDALQERLTCAEKYLSETGEWPHYLAELKRGNKNV